MFIPLYAIGAIAAIGAVLVVWAVSTGKKKIKEEKLTSFGYRLAMIVEGILINDALGRVDEIARRLA